MIDLLATIKFISGIILGTVFVVLVTIWILVILVVITDDDIKVNKVIKIIKSRKMAFLLPVLLVTILIPSKETMYTMMITNKVTPDNIQTVEETIKDSMDYAYCKFNDCNDKEEK